MNWNLGCLNYGLTDGYGMALAQSTAQEQQLNYALRMLGSQFTHPLSGLLLANYRPPNPIPWETRYADFCARLDKATSSRQPLG
jgi:hypothetical protein